MHSESRVTVSCRQPPAVLSYAMKMEVSLTSTARKIWMTALAVLAAVCVCSAPVLADEYTDALRKAKSEDKAVVLYFYNKYCPYCVAMEKDTLADKGIAATMKNSLASLRIDVDKRRDLGSKYGIRGYPTTCLLEPSGQLIVRIPGYLGKKEFKTLLEYARGKYYKTTGLKEYLKKAGIEAD
jgi:thioredoxin-related protein